MAGANPNNVDAGQLELVQQAFDHAASTEVRQQQTLTSVGTPVLPEIRQTTPAADMGMGYREASGTDPR